MNNTQLLNFVFDTLTFIRVRHIEFCHLEIFITFYFLLFWFCLFVCFAIQQPGELTGYALNNLYNVLLQWNVLVVCLFSFCFFFLHHSNIYDFLIHLKFSIAFTLMVLNGLAIQFYIGIKQWRHLNKRACSVFIFISIISLAVPRWGSHKICQVHDLAVNFSFFSSSLQQIIVYVFVRFAEEIQSKKNGSYNSSSVRYSWQ